ncbi:hypothetical protein WL278_12910 [Staphylococcus caprae]|jgi:hypothetical protein|uniref:hypothetical protein n=1 Tax=Staphylococcus TaxID=1279 RepID=UPI0002DCFEB2|nr:hypothetical protein [Staphylococcus epidermidis]MDU3977699.1 hypothetical protein [Staphylococcus sp.]MDS0933502.1 hypothetical protein [Staphylococcus epidermidis]MDU1576729.1 hypothetical protein [Staphylococcus epidermidis]MDU1623935.1 hypothetical protein [Staphylococcus epidermidis]MDU3949465.1 hypothetical protein [Staphylococcus epidermidis]
MKKLNLIKYNFQNTITHEFYNVSVELQKKLSLNIPIKYIYPLAFIYQNTFIFLILLFLFHIQETNVFSIVFILITIFNLLLPITLARTERNRLTSNPSYQILKLGELNNKESLDILLYSEIINFWIHNFMLEFITIFLLLVKFGYKGIPFIFLWILIISYLYKRYLLVNQKVTYKPRTAFQYLSSQLINLSLTVFIFSVLINPSKKIALTNFFSGDNIRNYFQHYFQKIESNILDIFGNYITYIYIFIAVFIYILGSYFWGSTVLKQIEKIKQHFLRKNNNVFLKRDINLINNTISQFNVSKYFLILPTATLFLLSVAIIYIINHNDSNIILISLDTLYWVTLYQTITYIIRYLPIINISSELRNVNLIYFSEKYQINDLIRAKYTLLFLFTSPIIIINLLVKTFVLFFTDLTLVNFILSIISTLLLTVTSYIVSLKWTLMGPKFNFDNLFMIRQERFDTQILQQFTIIPFRIITIILGFAFFVVNFINIHISSNLFSLYLVLCIFICSFFILLLHRRYNDEYYTKF